jgi:hypothetical protein
VGRLSVGIRYFFGRRRKPRNSNAPPIETRERDSGCGKTPEYLIVFRSKVLSKARRPGTVALTTLFSTMLLSIVPVRALEAAGRELYVVARGFSDAKAVCFTIVGAFANTKAVKASHNNPQPAVRIVLVI